MWINEFHYDHLVRLGTIEVGEFVEIAFPAGIDPNLYKLEFYRGPGGQLYNEQNLDSIIARDQEGFTFMVFPYSNGNLVQDGNGGMALVGRDGTVYDFVSYGGAFTATDGLAAGTTATDCGFTETAQTPLASSIRRTGVGCAPDQFTWVDGPLTGGIASLIQSASGLNEGQSIGNCPPGFPATPPVDPEATPPVDGNDGGGGGVVQPNSNALVADAKPPAEDEPCLERLWINEFHYQNLGLFDLTEFVEIAHTSTMNVNGYRVLFYSGADGTIYKEVSVPSAGLVSETQNGITVFGISVFERSNEVRNGPDAICVVDQSDNVLEFISYGSGTVTATAGPAAGRTAINVGVSESAETLPQNSLQKVGNGYRGSDFTWNSVAVTSSPGRINTGQTITVEEGCASVVTSEKQMQMLDVNGGADIPMELVYMALMFKFLESINAINIDYSPP